MKLCNIKLIVLVMVLSFVTIDASTSDCTNMRGCVTDMYERHLNNVKNAISYIKGEAKMNALCADFAPLTKCIADHGRCSDKNIANDAMNLIYIVQYMCSARGRLLISDLFASNACVTSDESMRHFEAMEAACHNTLYASMTSIIPDCISMKTMIHCLQVGAGKVCGPKMEEWMIALHSNHCCS